MRFLVDADLPRSATHLLRRYQHEVVDVRDIGLRDAKDHEIAAVALEQGLCLVTGDLDFADVRTYPPGRYFGLVVLRVPGAATSASILRILEGFLQQEDLVNRVRGSLAIVEPGRVRMLRG